MGSVYQKKHRRPVPAGASVKGGVASWTARGGKRVHAPVLDLGGGKRAVEVTGGVYYAKYRDPERGLVVESTGCVHKASARLWLAEKERQGERVRSGTETGEEQRLGRQRARPVGEHMEEFLATKGDKSKDYLKALRRELGKMAAALGWRTIADLRRDELERWVGEEASAPQPRSVRSRNEHVVAVKGFARWLVSVGRLASNPFAGVPLGDAMLDRRHPRRVLSAGEVERLAVAAVQAPYVPRPAIKLPGPRRADLWRVLYRTGLRLGEASQLVVADYRADRREPVLVLRAAVTKSGVDQSVPLLPATASLLDGFVKGKGPGDPLFNVPADARKAFRKDLARAGLAPRTAEGCANVHCLRTSFITALVLAGVPMPVVQKLARHADISTTAKYYVRLGLMDLHAGLGKVDWEPR